jgi:hypothetical protein
MGGQVLEQPWEFVDGTETSNSNKDAKQETTEADILFLYNNSLNLSENDDSSCYR